MSPLKPLRLMLTNLSDILLGLDLILILEISLFKLRTKQILLLTRYLINFLLLARGMNPERKNYLEANFSHSSQVQALVTIPKRKLCH